MKRRFLIGRLGIATTSAIVYPALVLTVAAGITFTAARVYAESAPAYACDSGPVLACSGKELGSPCEFPTGSSNACQTSFSLGERCGADDAGADADAGAGVGSGSFNATLACLEFLSCDAGEFTPCDGKGEGAPCTIGNNRQGTCATRGCSVLGSNQKYVSTTNLGCVEKTGSGSTSGAVTTRPSDPNPNGAAPASKDDGGCSTTGTDTGLLSSIGVSALALVLWRIRKRGQSPRRMQ